MRHKIYLSRSEHRAWGLEQPIGDATGGAAYGEFNDPVTSFIAANPVVSSSIASGLTGLLGANQQATAAESAARQQAQAANQAAALQQQMYEQQRQDYAPYREAGYTALKDIAGMKDYLTHQYGAQDFQTDPSYQWRLQQGQQAANQAANMSGGLLSGNTLRGMQDYTQGLASTEYNNAFNRYQTQRQGIYNTLAGIAGIGQNAQNTTSNLAQNVAGNIGQANIGAASALGAGQVGAANAYGNALNTLGNTFTLSQLLKQKQSVTPETYST